MYTIEGLARPTRVPLKRVRRGLRLLREWMQRHPDFFYLRPGAIAGELGLGRGAAVDVGFALRYWESIGLVFKERDSPARYAPTHRLLYILDLRGCLKPRACGKDAPCGLIGTMECPFLEGVASDGWAPAKA